MAENTNSTDEIIEAEVVSDGASPAAKKPWVTWAVIMLLVIACACLYWLHLQQKQTFVHLETQLADIKRIASDNSQIESQIQQQADRTESAIAQTEQQRQALTEKMKTLAESLQLSNAEIKQQWALAEVNGLLNTANQQLLLAGNVEAALKAIELADKRVEQLDDFRLHPLRALLAAEKMSLEEVSDVDIEGMVLKLQVAINQVDELQVVSGPAVTQNEQAVDAMEENTEATWQQALDGVWQEIRSLVVIRHKQDGSAAVLVPEQRYFLYQNLKLKLETARFALLRYDVGLFKDSLNSAAEWLNEYFVGSERDAMIQTLEALRQVSIKSELPDISASSTWLQQQGLTE